MTKKLLKLYQVTEDLRYNLLRMYRRRLIVVGVDTPLFVLKQLRWDIEDELCEYIEDIEDDMSINRKKP